MHRAFFPLLVALALAPSAVFAQVDDATRAAARNLGQSGVEAYQAGDFATASQKLEKAYRTLKVPSLGLWSARALVKNNKLVEAAERYREVTRLSISGGDVEVQRRAQADAEQELAELEPKIPSVIVTVEGAAADAVSVTIDDEPMAATLIGEKRPTNPGKHVIRGSAGELKASAEVTLAAGESKSAVLRFTSTGDASAPAAAAPSEAPATTATGTAPPPEDSPGQSSTQGSPMRTVAFVTIGVGAAGLLAGGVTGLLALGKKGEIDDSPNCDDNRCLRSEQGLVENYDTLRTVSTIGLIGGAVLATGGVVLLLTAPSEPERVGLRLGPSSVALQGKF